MRITNVTTKAGDTGETYLARGQKVSKDSPRVVATGTVDELNSVLGLTLATGLDDLIAPWVRRVQHELFRLGSELCVVGAGSEERGTFGLEERHVAQLEREIARLLEALPPLEEFLIPGGVPGAAWLHVARTVCRRAERWVVTLSKSESISSLVLRYLNRLSDWLFVLARHENRARGQDEPQWDRAK